MDNRDVAHIRKILAGEKKNRHAMTKLSMALVETVMTAMGELGEPITLQTLQDAVADLPGLRDRYLDTRWGKPIGHNSTLSQLELFTRRYSRDQIDKAATKAWAALSHAARP